MKPMYNLSFWQRFFLPIIWVVWSCTPIDKRKTWHEVKKGMEPHVCEWEETPYEVDGNEFFATNWYRCKHEGCSVVHPEMVRTKRGIELDEKIKSFGK